MAAVNMDKMNKCIDVMGFRADKNKEGIYSYPFQKLIRARNKKKNKNIWLVGTYRGMILVNELITEKELETGEGILRAAFTRFQDLEDTMELQWYTAPAILEMGYSMELSLENRDKVFLTMQELGAKRFTQVPLPILQRVFFKAAVRESDQGGEE